MNTFPTTLLSGKSQLFHGVIKIAIGKTPLKKTVWLGEFGLEEDEQEERRYHGSSERARHHFSKENYGWLAEQHRDWSTSVKQDLYQFHLLNMNCAAISNHWICVGFSQQRVSQ
jgi:hypothetical protein